ncbi:MAG: hypothetical protein D6E12_10995 [Desulfovibrio sp.]|nr:MAG: hypothetical protein D6E12_10995 [Desulfovibrio sp.]
MLDFYLFKQVHELYETGQIDEARSLLSDLQDKFIETCDENALLKTQIQEFEDVLFIAKNLEYDGFSYWLKTGTVRQGPFCRRCFDKDGLLIRLNEDEAKWKCLTCGSQYDHPVDMRPDLPAEPGPAKSEQGKVIHLYK